MAAVLILLDRNLAECAVQVARKAQVIPQLSLLVLSDAGQQWDKPVDDTLYGKLRAPAQPKPDDSQLKLLDRHLDDVAARYSASTPLKLFLLYKQDDSITTASKDYQLFLKLGNHHITLCHLVHQPGVDTAIMTKSSIQHDHHHQPRYWTSHTLSIDLLKHFEDSTLLRLLQQELHPTTAIFALGKLTSPIQTYPPLAWYNLPTDKSLPVDGVLDVLCFVLADAYFEATHPLQACFVLPRMPEQGRQDHLLLMLREAMLSQPVSAVVQCGDVFGVLELNQASVPQERELVLTFPLDPACPFWRHILPSAQPSSKRSKPSTQTRSYLLPTDTLVRLQPGNVLQQDMSQLISLSRTSGEVAKLESKGKRVCQTINLHGLGQAAQQLARKLASDDHVDASRSGRQGQRAKQTRHDLISKLQTLAQTHGGVAPKPKMVLTTTENAAARMELERDDNA
eukprot:m.38037 g.38037  ORF g.38037 m.38037 type:complete len:453 (+) comp12572_c0_seq1:16-1374(+)